MYGDFIIDIIIIIVYLFIYLFPFGFRKLVHKIINYDMTN